MPDPAGRSVDRAELVIAGLCLLAGALFFAALGRLWPLATMDLVEDPGRLQAEARRFLVARGFDLDRYRSTSALTVDDAALDYVEAAFGRPRAQAWIAEGLPLFQYRADFKRFGSTATLAVYLLPEAPILGWSRSVEDDEPGPRLAPEEARELAREAIAAALGLDLARWDERTASATEQLARRDHAFVWERTIAEAPELRERVRAVVTGGDVSLVRRALVVPPAAARAYRAAEAPGTALETTGFVLAVGGCLAALVVFVLRLRAGSASLGLPAILGAVVFGCLIGTWALEAPSVFRAWEPLWPRWISAFLYLAGRAVEGLGVALIVIVFASSADALDRERGAGRGRTLWTLARGRVDAGVALASARGFLVGLLCGGAMTASVGLLELAAGAWTSIQPRGFFFYPLNTLSPAATSVLFFLGIALAEELGYRFFGGTWLEALTRRRWVATLVPALVYGLVHTRFDFLPPAAPWWGRAFVLTAVGCVWGWAFLRYDALTVVLSHFTADLFIFNWPRLACGETAIVVASAATIAVPLLPAAIGAAAWAWQGRWSARPAP